MNPTIEKDVNDLTGIDAVNMILQSLQRITKMRVSLVAQIDSGLWTSCNVLDKADFGIKLGDQLDLATTY